MIANSNSKNECVYFTKYLIGQNPSDKVLQLYEKALNKPVVITDKDLRVLKFILMYPQSIGSVDAGLALLQPNSEIRRRLYYLFGILEIVPEYSDYFLPKPRNLGFLFVIVWIGIVSIIQTLIGFFLLKVIIR